ncbi:flagellar assembly protein FliW [Bacteriovorax stolpii]|uniref:Flagellar assembly factor FliW n=1 Tax=Bacteriovorax stolpii TaxID=960 RepID=A0A2K9NWY2_BACTC|nr:flagellar assembly protein FliW [Bacteriovorax stolpii]QDK39974.1 flagellar assembly protein FliW [Bacteriovorax stolpii]
MEVGYSTVVHKAEALTVKIKTTRFGELEVDKKDIIEFTEGLLGFENLKKFFIVDPGDQTLILWLQSTDDAATAFPIIEPKIFQPNYMVKLLPVELNSLALENLSNASVYTVLTIPQNVTEMSANLKAPIIINNKTKMARQIVLQDSKLEVRFKMYMDLKKYIVNYSTNASDDSKRTNVAQAARDNGTTVVSTNTANTTTKTNSPEAN